jgi:hypothetical protein
MQAANALPAKPAAFDQSSQYRRAMTAKIIAWRQIGMCEDDYRQLLLETTGKLYLKECSDGDLIMVIDRLKAKGFKPIPRKKVAMHPFAQKARAMWKSLYYLGAVHSPSEEALEAFAKRQLKCERLVWARQSDSEKVIGAPAIDGGARGLAPALPRHPEAVEAADPEIIIVSGHSRQAERGWRRLSRLGSRHGHVAFVRIENAREHAWSPEDYDKLAAALGNKLREAVGTTGGRA